MIVVLTIGNTTYPENITTISESLKVPDGNVFKYCLYGMGVEEFEFSGISWNSTSKREVFLYNYPEDFSPSSIRAMYSDNEQQPGKYQEGVTKSVLSGDSSFFVGEAYCFTKNFEKNIIDGSLNKVTSCEGHTFTDITYVQEFVSLVDHFPKGSHSSGSICRIPIKVTQLYYKASEPDA